MNEFTLSSETPVPKDREDFIAERTDGKREHVEVRNGVVYLWRYGSTDEIWCSASDIVKWRGCGGFDY